MSSIVPPSITPSAPTTVTSASDIVDVREIRRRLGYTQSRLGALLGVHGLTVHRWEHGGRVSPDKLRLFHAIDVALCREPEALPRRLRCIGSDPLRELTAILIVLHPDLAIAP